MTLPRFAFVHDGRVPHLDLLAARLRGEGGTLDELRLEPARSARGADVPIPARWSPAALVTIPILLARWQNERPVLVHVHEGPGALRVLEAARIAGVPVRTMSFDARGVAGAGSDEPWIARRLLDRARGVRIARLVALTDAVVALHPAAARALRPHTSPDALHVFAAGWGLDTDALLTEGSAASRQRAARQALGLPEGGRIVVCPIRSEPARESVASLAHALRRVAAEVEVYTLDETAQAARRASPEGPTIPWTRADRARWVDAADAVVLLDPSAGMELAAAAALRRTPVAQRADIESAGTVVGETSWPLRGGAGTQAEDLAALLRDPVETQVRASRARGWAARTFDRDVTMERLMRLWSRLLLDAAGAAGDSAPVEHATR